jgi:hypothetical protein
MRKQYDYGKIDLENLTDLHVMITVDYKNVFFGIPFVFEYVCMCALLAPERLDEFHLYAVFKSLSTLSWCPVNMNILSPEIRVIQINPHLKNQDCHFFENDSDNLD